MNVVLLRMARLEDDPAVWREAVLPNITTLKSLSSTIQEAFALGSDGAFEYEVFGCRAPGCRARLRDLLTSGVTRVRYLHGGARQQQVEIAIVPMQMAHLERSTAGSSERPHGTVR
jgi:hypothetical protein